VNAAALEADLRSLGVSCTVEARESLALLVPNGDPGRLAASDVRREVVRLAEARGFTHIAIELPDGGAMPDASDRSRS
jgi:hypothetical protein